MEHMITEIVPVVVTGHGRQFCACMVGILNVLELGGSRVGASVKRLSANVGATKSGADKR